MITSQPDRVTSNVSRARIFGRIPAWLLPVVLLIGGSGCLPVRFGPYTEKLQGSTDGGRIVQVADLNGDASVEILWIGEHTIHIERIVGARTALVKQIDIPDDFSYNGTWDVAGDNLPEIVVSKVDRTTGRSWLEALGPWGDVVYRSEAVADVNAEDVAGQRIAPALTAVGVLNRPDGNLLIARLHTGYRRTPRGLVAFDLSTQGIVWRRSFGVVPNSVLLEDVNHDGARELVVVGFAAANGVTINGISDGHSWLLAYSAEGEELWRRRLGGEHTVLQGAWVEGEPPSEPVIVVSRFRGNEPTDRASLWTIEARTGAVLDSVVAGTGYYNPLLISDCGRHPEEIWVGGEDGTLCRYDPRLHLKGRRALGFGAFLSSTDCGNALLVLALGDDAQHAALLGPGYRRLWSTFDDRGTHARLCRIQGRTMLLILNDERLRWVTLARRPAPAWILPGAGGAAVVLGAGTLLYGSRRRRRAWSRPARDRDTEELLDATQDFLHRGVIARRLASAIADAKDQRDGYPNTGRPATSDHLNSILPRVRGFLRQCRRLSVPADRLARVEGRMTSLEQAAEDDGGAVERLEDLRLALGELVSAIQARCSARPAECATQVIAEHGPELAEHHVSVQFRCTPEALQARAFVLPWSLARILGHLVENAIQATAACGNAEVSIALEADEAHVFLDVTDSGRGIPPSDYERVFDRGYSTTGGTGMGLHWVREQLRRTEGSVRIHASAPDRGTTLRVQLRAVVNASNAEMGHEAESSGRR